MATPEAAPEATAAPARPDEDCLQAQYDECLSLSLIFPDEFRLLSGLATSTTTADAADLTLLSPDDLAHPISFSVRLRPADDDDDAENTSNGHDQQQLWPSDRSFALVVTYPPSYPCVAPIFSFSSSALHPVQEEACLTSILTDIRPDLDANNPCILTAVASARQFFLDGGLATGLLHSIDEDALTTILAFAATDAQVVEDVMTALAIFDVVSKRNEVWKQLCQRRWRTKWGFERRWRVALKEYRNNHHHHHQQQHSNATTSAMGTWWYDRYMWQEEDAKRNDMTVEELTDPSILWDVRSFFQRSNRDRPEYMRDVRVSGLRRSVEMLQFVRLHDGADSDHLPKNMSKDKGHCAGPIRRCDVASDDDLNTSWCWCLANSKEQDSDNNNNNNNSGQCPQIVALYSREVVHTGSGLGIQNEVHRLDSWGWEMRNFQRAFRSIDVSLSVSDDDGAVDERSLDAKVAEARTRLDDLWSDYVENLITEEKPAWVKPRKQFDHLNYREIPNDDDLKAFLPW